MNDQIKFFIPFILFISIYLLLSEYFYRNQEIITPNFIGKNILSCINELQSTGLAYRIIHTVVDELKPEGTILFQYPAAQTKIKYQSTISFKVSVKKKEKDAPNVVGIKYNDACKILELKGFLWKKKEIEIDYPNDFVYAQGINYLFNIYGDQSKEIILFVAKSNNDKNYIIKKLIGIKCLELKEIAIKNGIKISCFSKSSGSQINHEHNDNIIDQRPSPGSCINNKNSICVWHE